MTVRALLDGSRSGRRHRRYSVVVGGVAPLLVVVPSTVGQHRRPWDRVVVCGIVLLLLAGYRCRRWDSVVIGGMVLSSVGQYCRCWLSSFVGGIALSSVVVLAWVGQHCCWWGSGIVRGVAWLQVRQSCHCQLSVGQRCRHRQSGIVIAGKELLSLGQRWRWCDTTIVLLLFLRMFKFKLSHTSLQKNPLFDIFNRCYCHYPYQYD